MVKRGVQAILVASAAILPLLLTDAAMAATNNCSIYTTGSDSYNACIASNKSQTYVTCVNNVYTVFTNSQTSTSGGATNSNNTTTGNTTSGSAVNANGTSVTIGATCSAPVTTTPTPGTGGGGGTTTTPTTTSGSPKTTVTQPAIKSVASTLPETGSNFLTEAALIGLATAAGVLACSKIGVSLLQRVSQK